MSIRNSDRIRNASARAVQPDDPDHRSDVAVVSVASFNSLGGDGRTIYTADSNAAACNRDLDWSRSKVLSPGQTVASPAEWPRSQNAFWRSHTALWYQRHRVARHQVLIERCQCAGTELVRPALGPAPCHSEQESVRRLKHVPGSACRRSAPSKGTSSSCSLERTRIDRAGATHRVSRSSRRSTDKRVVEIN